MEETVAGALSPDASQGEEQQTPCQGTLGLGKDRCHFLVG